MPAAIQFGGDETNAVLPGVTVTAADIQTGRQFSDVTNDRGQFGLVNMQAGRYKIQVELAGFATVVMPEVELLARGAATHRALSSSRQARAVTGCSTKTAQARVRCAG